MAIIGIDLGTTNSLCAYWKDGKSRLIPNAFGTYITPSVVSVNEDGSVVVGKLAKERLQTHPLQTAANYKIFMGTNKTFSFGGKEYKPEELSALVLRQLKDDAEAYLQEEVTEAVISVPAYFNDNQRNATKLAGELAGLKVDRIINEPSAAALAYKKELTDDQSFIVFDLGGGTLDISLVDYYENIVEIVAISGDNHFGGNDFDLSILEYFFLTHPILKDKLNAEETASLKKQAELCKISLSENPEVLMVFKYQGEDYPVHIDQTKLIKILSPFLLKIHNLLEKVLKDSRRKASSIDDVLLVGGSTKMPVIQKYIASIMKQPNTSINPDSAIALGTGVVVGIHKRSEEIKDVVLTDICPFTLGTDVYDFASKKIQFHPMIQRNSTLPCSVTHSFFTLKDNQSFVEFSIFQGESLEPKENLLLDHFTFPIPPKPAGQVAIIVTFSYDINSILLIDAVCNDNDTSLTRVITNNRKMTEEEKAKHIAAIKSIKEKSESMDKTQNEQLLARASQLFEEAAEDTRPILLERIQYFQRAVGTTKKIDAQKARNEFADFLAALDGFDVWD